MTEELALKRLSLRQEGEVTVAQLVDTQLLDEASIKELAAALQQVLARPGVNKLVVNFAEVTFMSHAILGKLVVLNREARKKQAQLVFCCIKSSIMEVFKITNLHRVLVIVEDEQQALAQINKPLC